MKDLRRLGVALAFSILFFFPKDSYAISRTSKVYVVTSTYGVMAGTLTGIASLAFYSKPKTHLRNVAMGASIGLYVGLLMGTYMIYFVGDSDSSSQKETAPANPENPLNLPEAKPEGDENGMLQPIEMPALQPMLAYDPQTKTTMIGVNYTF